LRSIAALRRRFVVEGGDAMGVDEDASPLPGDEPETLGGSSW
jgi:hypothetical protein